MKKLKTINLKELGIKNLSILEKTSSLDFSLAEENNYHMEKKKVFPFVAENFCSDRKWTMRNDKRYQKKFLPYVNIIEDIEEDKQAFINKQEINWEEKIDNDKFEPGKDLKKEIIPLTFKKNFYQAIQKNILKMAAESPSKLQSLIENIQIEIQADAFLFLDKQIKEMIHQVDNYAKQAKIIKTAKDFQKTEQVLKWIIDTSVLIQYNSRNWNKNKQNTSCAEKEQLLIIDSSLHKQIELEKYKEEERSCKDGKTFPLPLHKIWGQFASIIIAPLENNFKFIILDQKVLVGWYKFRKLEIKYDEEKKITYFLRGIDGGFKQLPYFNAVAFIQKD